MENDSRDTPMMDFVNQLIAQASEAEKADIYTYSGPICEDGFHGLQEGLIETKYSRAILTLTTDGGDGSAAYRIAQHFHQKYKRFSIYVPVFCRSAGTILALGAHDLIMNPHALLGPINPQKRKHDKICVAESAQATLGQRHKLATDTAIEYGKRLIEVSGNASEKAVELLVTAHPGHDFAIDFAEASRLFRNVSAPSELLRMFATAEQMEWELQEQAAGDVADEEDQPAEDQGPSYH